MTPPTIQSYGDFDFQAYCRANDTNPKVARLYFNQLKGAGEDWIIHVTPGTLDRPNGWVSITHESFPPDTEIIITSRKADSQVVYDVHNASELNKLTPVEGVKLKTALANARHIANKKYDHHSETFSIGSLKNAMVRAANSIAP